MLSPDAAMRDPYWTGDAGLAAADPMDLDPTLGRGVASPDAGFSSGVGFIPSPGVGAAIQGVAAAIGSASLHHGVAPTPVAHSVAATPTTAGWSITGAVGEDSPAHEAPTAEPTALPWPAAPPGEAEVISFFALVKAPPAGADAAARRFLNLLSMHMEGQVTLEQEEPYGDISIHRGLSWPGGLAVEDYSVGGA